MNYKKRLIILVCSIFIYLGIIYIYNNINDENYIEVFILKNDILRGNLIELKDLEKILIKSNNELGKSSVLNENEIENFVPKKDLSKGCILSKEDLVEKSNFNKSDNDTEIISIKISNPDDIVSYQIEKNSVVNLYYTGRLDLAKCIIEKINLPNIVTKSNNTNSFNSDYVTVKLAENIKVINLFDKYGNIMENTKVIKNDSNKIDTVMFEVKKDFVMIINNLKKYGDFSISILR